MDMGTSGAIVVRARVLMGVVDIESKPFTAEDAECAEKTKFLL
jgi:hypothetical protein